MKILAVVGARPNFMKIAPLARCLEARGHASRLVHTGQHYDDNMSEVFFRELGIAPPDVHLGVGSGSHAEQTARCMIAFEKVCLDGRPDLVVVVGDVNSTLACTLVSAKLGIPVAHVEAGLRSFDLSMPEEINRLVTDRLAEILLTPSPEADLNLIREGVPRERIHFVGNIMIDSLVASLDEARRSRILERLGLSPRGFGVLTLHRPANVDDPEALGHILGAVREIAQALPIVFSCHPRTGARLESLGHRAGRDLHVLPPLGYLDFLKVLSESRLVLTDSGGLQEESTYLGIPCITLRENTERPVTIERGTNVLAGRDPTRILAAAREALRGARPRGQVPELWDGRTAPRIVDVFERWWGPPAGAPRRLNPR